MNTIFRFFTLLLLLLLTTAANGQRNYRDGRVITTENDTLFGKIKDCGILRNTKVCLFKENGQGRVTEYYPQDLKSYRAFGDKYYMSKELVIDEVPRSLFLEVLIEGEVSLFYYYKNKDTLYYIQQENGELIGLINERLVTDKPHADITSAKTIFWNEYEVYRTVYKDTLRSMFNEVEAVAKQVYNLEYDQESLMGIVEDYIFSTCIGDDCIVYETKEKESKDKFGVFSGAQFSTFYFTGAKVPSSLDVSVPIGLLYNIPLVLINERLSLQAELIYNQLNFSQNFYFLTEDHNSITLKSDIIRIPLKIKYEFLIDKLTPTISLGNEVGIMFNSEATLKNTNPTYNTDPVPEDKNLFVYRYQKGSWFIDLGINYAFNSDFSVFSGIRLQKHFNKLVEDLNSNEKIFKVAEGDKYETRMVSLFFGLTF